MKSGSFIYKGKSYPVKITETHEEQQHGLMGEKFPPPNMAFKVSVPSFQTFWMKNTPSPLDLIFIKDNKIIDIKKGYPNSLEMISCGQATNCVIEVPSGLCSLLGMKPGDEIKLQG
jgi:uncharacterized membrane protein (UPF0127 family)